MKTLLIITAALTLTATMFAAELKTADALAPAQFIGKTFEDCEKLLGKPLSRENNTDDGENVRFYDPSVASITKIRLACSRDYTVKGHPTSKTVTSVSYYFPSGSFKTWKEAIALFGLISDSTTKHPDNNKDNTVTIRAAHFPKGWRDMRWFPSATTMKWPEKYRLPDEDFLQFSYDPTESATQSPK